MVKKLTVLLKSYFHEIKQIKMIKNIIFLLDKICTVSIAMQLPSGSKTISSYDTRHVRFLLCTVFIEAHQSITCNSIQQPINRVKQTSYVQLEVAQFKRDLNTPHALMNVFLIDNEAMRHQCGAPSFEPKLVVEFAIGTYYGHTTIYIYIYMRENNCFFFNYFICRRHRCPHGPEKDHQFVDTTETVIDTTSSSHTDFVDHRVTDVTLVREPLKRPVDNLKPEGDFARPEKTEYRPAERPTQKKPEDNLRPEGDFDRPDKLKFTPAERPTQKKPEDNLRPEGDFERPEKSKFEPAERPTQKRPEDNLRPEGEFVRPDKPQYAPAERPTQKKPEDNLKPEGDFTRPEKSKYEPAERPTQKKPQDNLKPEGDFDRPEKSKFEPAERPTQTIPKDNLRPEGDFYTPEKNVFSPAERVTGVRPMDNLTITGDFTGKSEIAHKKIVEL